MRLRKTADDGLVGLDIGSSSIKLVELRAKRDRYELVNLALKNLGADAIVDGAIMDEGSVSSTIEKMFEEARISSKKVATSVSGRAVIVKRVVVTAGTQEELDTAIQQEVAQQIPFDLASVQLNYYVLGPLQETDSLDWQADRYHAARKLEVLLLAVKREKIQAHTNVLIHASKTPSVMDLDAFALQNAFELSYEPPSQQTVALLNIGASTMNINIIRGGLPLFTRDASIGGNQYTDTLQKELNLTFDEAEQLKAGIDLARVQPESELPHLRSVSELLLLEVQKAFDAFHQTIPDPIQAVYLAGGTARIRGLADLLGAELKMPVEVLDPFRKIRFNPRRFGADFVATLAPRMTVAVGLALRSFDAA